MNTYPSNKLPAPTLDFSGTNQSSTIRTRMDSGRVRQKRRFTKDYRTCMASWVFDDTQFSLFQAFIYYKCSSGADWFLITIPQGSGMRQFQVRLQEGKYSYSHTGVLSWKVSATIELYDAQLMTEAAYNAAVA